MAKLRRVSDGAGDEGSSVEAITWNKDGTFLEVVGNKPIVGCSLKVGSVTARTYSEQDWWMTTPITDILEETDTYIKFKTENSTYEFWK